MDCTTDFLSLVGTEQIMSSLCLIYNKSLSCIDKNGNKNFVQNYWSASLLSAPANIFEKSVFGLLL